MNCTCKFIAVHVENGEYVAENFEKLGQASESETEISKNFSPLYL